MGILVDDIYYNYLLGALATPIQDRSQLDSMFILHFDIPDKEAHEIVTKAITRYLENLRREYSRLKSELHSIQRMINRLVEYTPEL